jgi:uncharacterized membrane-anchored protein
MLVRWLAAVAITFALATGTVAPACADTAPAAPDPAAATEEARKAESISAFAAAMADATRGPAAIPLMGEATLKLPDGYFFVPPKQANRLMRAWGNGDGGDTFAGMIMPANSDEAWFITAHFLKEGYVKDEEAKNWDVDGLLKNAQDGVEQDNSDRAARGFPKIKVDGWIEKPGYDTNEHRLVYSISLSGLDAKPGDEASVNYHTFALGREGYFALDLVTGSTTIEQFKSRAATVLAALEYDNGKRYGDFVAGTDRTAEYGIAALVGGLAAKKLGLLALGALALTKFGAWAIAFAKPLAVGVVALFAGAARFFRRKS